MITVQDAFKAAEHHALAASEPEHQIGDLEDMVRVAYSLMTKEQRQKFLNSEAVRGLVEQEL